MKIKSLIVILSMILVFQLCAGIVPAYASGYKVGDYVSFGSYYGKPVVWRIINVDELGNPLLYSDRIIALKSFDSKGTKMTDYNFNREAYGSNYWKDSNIRQWLNSSDKSINWTQNAPSKQNVFNKYNSYDTEKGFLADGNFTKAERNAILTSISKTTLNSSDRTKKEGGTADIQQWSANIADVVKNYDEVNYQNTSEKVFFLSIKELSTYVYNNSAVLGSDYHITKPTEQAVLTSNYKDLSLSSDKKWSYWLRTPYDNSNVFGTSAVRYVSSDGVISNYGAADDLVGIRPALSVDVSKITIKSGDGSANQPYIWSASYLDLQLNVTASNYNYEKKVQAVDYEVINTGSSDISANVVIVLYKDGKTISVSAEPASFTKNSTKTVTKEIPLANPFDNITVKAFIWDSLKGIKPVAY